MTSKTVCRTSGPVAMGSSHLRPTPAQEHKAVLSRKRDQDKKLEDDKSRGVPVEHDVEQASVRGEAERPLPPSEKPEVC